MLGPFLSVYLLFVVAPIVLTFVLSFTQWNGVTSPKFVGTDTFDAMLHSASVTKAFTNLIIYVVITVPLGMAVGLGLALFINRLSGRLGAFMRSAVFFPYIMPLFITALIWRWMLDPSFGIIDQILVALGGPALDWRQDPVFMMAGLIIVDIWHSAGFNMLLLLAGLKSIPAELYEAAKLDGAGVGREIWSVTLPQLRPVFFMVTANAFISAFQVFDLPWLLTESQASKGTGGPHQGLLFPVMEAVIRSTGGMRFGDAAVIGVLLLGLIALTTAVSFLIRRRWEDD
jgi:multiple sugar transport system permease protein